MVQVTFFCSFSLEAFSLDVCCLFSDIVINVVLNLYIFWKIWYGNLQKTHAPIMKCNLFWHQLSLLLRGMVKWLKKILHQPFSYSLFTWWVSSSEWINDTHNLQHSICQNKNVFFAVYFYSYKRRFNFPFNHGTHKKWK